MHVANKLRLHLINCKLYYYFIFNCHFKFKGMQCNVYVYRICEIKTNFMRYVCRYFSFNLKNVGMGHAKKRQNVKFTMFKMHFS